MNREDIIRMAQKAGYGPSLSVLHVYALERFAALAAAAEREACALTCEGIAADDQSEDSAAQDCAAAIRARGDECIQEAEGADID